MFNNGILESMKLNYTNFYAGSSSRYIKVVITAHPIWAEITIDKQNKIYLDWKSNFKPTERTQMDYFLRAESHVTNEKDFYHDSNGYLVSKRILNTRPDYEWEYKQGDKINANTYPACSFVYLKNTENKVRLF